MDAQKLELIKTIITASTGIIGALIGAAITYLNSNYFHGKQQRKEMRVSCIYLLESFASSYPQLYHNYHANLIEYEFLRTYDSLSPNVVKSERLATVEERCFKDLGRLSEERKDLGQTLAKVAISYKQHTTAVEELQDVKTALETEFEIAPTITNITELEQWRKVSRDKLDKHTVKTLKSKLSALSKTLNQFI